MTVFSSTELDEGTSTVSSDELNAKVADSDINILGFAEHSKASEKYVVAEYRFNGRWKEWYIPYYYRRTNVLIDTESELVDLVKDSKQYLSHQNIEAFKKDITNELSNLFGSGSDVTRPIFEIMLKNCGEWVCNAVFNNVNSQRRIQDIKEMGFTLSTKWEGRKTFHILLPFPQQLAPTYETIPTHIRKRIVKALNNIDAYSGKLASISVLPDHKFSEIRWDTDTPVSNEDLTEQEMREKFQLVPERINQAKREVCRKCFQTGCRGKLNEIDFFYSGTDRWDSRIQKTGKKAEAGCVGCFWYDMAAWRKALNQFIKEHL